jgi:hypothetical protein
MALWGSIDQANNAPKYTNVAGVSANGEVLYGNTQISAFVTNQAVGTFGVDSTEAGVTSGDGKKVAHAGWNLRKSGTGPVVSISANTGSYSPDGNVYITFTGGGTGTTAANAQVKVNSVSKLILSVELNSGGVYESTPTAAATNANAVFTITMGGRANRVQYETLVSMGSMEIGGNSDDTLFPDS